MNCPFFLVYGCKKEWFREKTVPPIPLVIELGGLIF
jgi:hypothetical protein